MSTSQYGEWEARGEKIDAAVYNVAARHHLHGTQCLCGFESHRARSRTEHIIDETLAALAGAGVLPRTDEERNGPELSAYLRSFTDPRSGDPSQSGPASQLERGINAPSRDHENGSK